MRNDEPDTIDRVLEEALSRYSSQEPLAGLEQRVLQRVQTEGPRRRRLFGRWMFVAGGAVAAGFVFMAMNWPAPSPVPGRVVLPLPRQSPVLSVAKPLRRPSPPRREFPSPAPITREERALLALAARAPDETREAFLDLQQRSMEPVRVEEIKIEPLQSDGLR